MGLSVFEIFLASLRVVCLSKEKCRGLHLGLGYETMMVGVMDDSR